MKITGLQLIFVLFLFLSQNIGAQNMKVETMELVSMDLSASTTPREDFNGKACALVKVSMTVSNVTFGGNVIGNVLRDGSDYWVYMPDGSKMLQVKHPNYKTLLVTFPNFGIDHIEAKKTYLLNISLPYISNLGAVNQEASEGNTTDGSKYISKTFKPKKIKNYMDAFFPIFGITPGTTSPSDAQKLGYNPEGSDLIRLQDTYFGIVYKDNNDKFNHIQVTRSGKGKDNPKMPKKWAEDFGFDMTLSYNEWLSLFNSLGFRIDVKKEPTVVEYNDKNILKGEFRATEPSGKFYFDLIFGNINVEEASVYAPNTLLTFNLLYIDDPTLADKLGKTKNSTKGFKSSPSINTFFPVYGVTLGQTTWYDMSKAGYRLISNPESSYAEVLSLNFHDFENKGYFDKLYFTASDMPPAWQKLGFQEGNSYETWINLLEDMGFTIIVTKEPEIEMHNDKEALYAEFTAVSEDAHLKMEFEFRYGEEGSSLSSPGTLYAITMTAQ